MALNKYVVRGALVGALGGLLFGFDTAVIAGVTDALTRVFTLSAKELGVTVSIALVGTVLGAMTAGWFESRYGGRAMLRVMAIFYLLSAFGCAFAPNWGILLAARLLGGIGVGGSSVLGPVYIAEISPSHLRGRLVGMFQINIVIGVLLAYVSNFVIARANVGAIEWRLQLGVAALPALLFFVLLFTIPPSARWLAARGRSEEARGVMTQIGSTDPDLELRTIAESMESSSSENLFQRKYRKPILLAISLAMFNQLSGINVFIYYANTIFGAAGFSRMSGFYQAVALGLTNLIATLFAMTLIDRLGRRKLLLIGSVGTAICLFGVAFVFSRHDMNFLLLPFLIVFIIFFALSQGAVIWVYLSEIFPTQVRGKGQSLGSSTHWIMDAILVYAFPVVVYKLNATNHSPAIPFLFFAGMVCVQFVAVKLFYPETQNTSLEELQKQLETV